MAKRISYNIEKQGDKQYTNTLASSLFMTTENGYEPQRTNNFEFSVTGLDTLTKAGYSKIDGHTNGYSQKIAEVLESSDLAQELILSVNSAFTPRVSLSQLTIQYGNTQTKYAGIPSYDNGTIAYNDFYDKDTELILKAWQYAAFDEETGAVGDAENYKKTAYLTMFSPSGRKAGRYKFIGWWVADVNGDDFSNDGNNIRRLSATIVYDKAVRLTEFNVESATSKEGGYSSDLEPDEVSI